MKYIRFIFYVHKTGWIICTKLLSDHIGGRLQCILIVSYIIICQLLLRVNSSGWIGRQLNNPNDTRKQTGDSLTSIVWRNQLFSWLTNWLSSSCMRCSGPQKRHMCQPPMCGFWMIFWHFCEPVIEWNLKMEMYLVAFIGYYTCPWYCYHSPINTVIVNKEISQICALLFTHTVRSNN